MAVTTVDMLQRMYDHLEWADDLTFREVGSIPHDSPQFARAVEIYAHLASTQQVWLSRIQESTPASPIWPRLSIDASHQLFKRGLAGFRDLIAQIAGGSRSFEDPFTYRNSKGDEYTNGIGDALVHVALHGAYHRGQLALLTRQGGAIPVLTDYIAYVREQPI